MKNRGYITITGLENKDEQPIVSVKIENGNVWMTKHELARLFGVFVQTIDANVRSIFKSRLLYDGDVTITRNRTKALLPIIIWKRSYFSASASTPIARSCFVSGYSTPCASTNACKRKSPKSLLFSIPTATGLPFLITNVHRNL